MKNAKRGAHFAAAIERRLVAISVLCGTLSLGLWTTFHHEPLTGAILSVAPLLFVLLGRAWERRPGDRGALGRAIALAAGAVVQFGLAAGIGGSVLLIGMALGDAGPAEPSGYILMITGELLFLVFLVLGAVFAALSALAVWRTRFADRWF